MALTARRPVHRAPVVDRWSTELSGVLATVGLLLLGLSAELADGSSVAEPLAGMALVVLLLAGTVGLVALAERRSGTATLRPTTGLGAVAAVLGALGTVLFLAFPVDVATATYHALLAVLVVPPLLAVAALARGERSAAAYLVALFPGLYLVAYVLLAFEVL